jgi:hypothetical protein
MKKTMLLGLFALVFGLFAVGSADAGYCYGGYRGYYAPTYYAPGNCHAYYGRHCNFYNNYYYDAGYGCNLYYSPSYHCNYYWCAPHSCYYPVSYCPFGVYAF